MHDKAARCHPTTRQSFFFRRLSRREFPLVSFNVSSVKTLKPLSLKQEDRAGRLEQGWICNLWPDRLQASKKRASLDKYHAVNVRRHNVWHLKLFFFHWGKSLIDREESRDNRTDISNKLLDNRIEIILRLIFAKNYT